MIELFTKLQQKIRIWQRRKQVLPSYDDKRKVIDGYRSRFQPSIFIETGTFLGDTVNTFINKFDQLYSVELSEELAAEASARFKDHKNVKIIQGDSGIVLASLVPTLEDRALFWLDGHYSSKFHVGDRLVETAKGEVYTPVSEELEVILNSPIPHVILIDDARLFNGKDDYPSIKSIRKKVLNSNHSYEVSVNHDIIHIIPLQ